MPTHATALFADRHAAHAAVEQLVQAGFPRDTISVMMLASTHEREFGGGSSESADGSGLQPTRPTGVLWTIVSGLAEVSQLEGPPWRGAGPLAGALLRAVEDVDSEGFAKAMASAGLADHEATFLHHGVRGGSIAVGVYAVNGERGRLASQLLELAGGAALQAA